MKRHPRDLLQSPFVYIILGLPFLIPGALFYEFVNNHPPPRSAWRSLSPLAPAPIAGVVAVHGWLSAGGVSDMMAAMSQDPTAPKPQPSDDELLGMGIDPKTGFPWF